MSRIVWQVLEIPFKKKSAYAFKCVKLYGHFIRRYSITDAEKFSHYRNPSYIVREVYPPFGRDIVRLETVCWLKFKMIMSRIPSERYEVSIHFQLRADLYWTSGIQNWRADHNCIAHLKVIDEDVGKNEPLIVNVDIEADNWKQIQNGQFNNKLLKGNATVMREPNSLKRENWFFYKS